MFYDGVFEFPVTSSVTVAPASLGRVVEDGKGNKFLCCKTESTSVAIVAGGCVAHKSAASFHYIITPDFSHSKSFLALGMAMSAVAASTTAYIWVMTDGFPGHYNSVVANIRTDQSVAANQYLVFRADGVFGSRVADVTSTAITGYLGIALATDTSNQLSTNRVIIGKR